MTRRATPAEQAQCTALGIELLTRVNSFIDDLREPGPVDPEQRSQEVGRMLLMSVCAAANDVEWLNRLFIVQGLGVALGEISAQWPIFQTPLRIRLDAGMAAGLREARS